MPFYQWDSQTNPDPQEHWLDGLQFAQAAVEFAGMAWAAEQSGKVIRARLHLYALSIELGFKSLALRAGATPADCKNAGHRISEMIRLVQENGVSVPSDVTRRLNNDDWFKKMLGSRYPIYIANLTLANTLFFHSNYPEIIASVLEIPCICPLTFNGGNALAEIRGFAEIIKVTPRDD